MDTKSSLLDDNWLNASNPLVWKEYGLSAELRPYKHLIVPPGIDKPSQERYEANQKAAIRGHNLVSRYVEEYPEIKIDFLCRRKGFMYFDILKMAEVEYLDGESCDPEMAEVMGWDK